MATPMGFRIYSRPRSWKIFLAPQPSRRVHRAQASRREENVAEFAEREFDESRQRLVREIVERNTEITRDHLTPELRLRLLTPNCRLYEAPVDSDGAASDDDLSPEAKALSKRIFRDPFWSIYWPGGQALARFVLDSGRELVNKSKTGTSFLDLGCGCGASAIAAKMMGARRVIANDIDPVACVAAQMNATLNNVSVEISTENLLADRDSRDEPTSDVILVGDLLYDEETAEALIPWLEKASRRNGSRIYLGDPGRHALTEELKSRMKLERTYALPENVRRENRGYDTATVWRFLPRRHSSGTVF